MTNDASLGGLIADVGEFFERTGNCTEIFESGCVTLRSSRLERPHSRARGRGGAICDLANVCGGHMAVCPATLFAVLGRDKGVCASSL